MLCCRESWVLQLSSSYEGARFLHWGICVLGCSEKWIHIFSSQMGRVNPMEAEEALSWLRAFSRTERGGRHSQVWVPHGSCLCLGAWTASGCLLSCTGQWSQSPDWAQVSALWVPSLPPCWHPMPTPHRPGLNSSPHFPGQTRSLLKLQTLICSASWRSFLGSEVWPACFCRGTLCYPLSWSHYCCLSAVMFVH